MNKTDLINKLAERLDGDKKTAQEAVEGFIDLVQREVQAGRSVSISGFGVFEKRARAARTARNPRTGEAVKVKKTTVPAFRPGKYFKDVIAGTVKLPKSTGAPPVRRAAAAAAKARHRRQATAAAEDDRRTRAPGRPRRRRRLRSQPRLGPERRPSRRGQDRGGQARCGCSRDPDPRRRRQARRQRPLHRSRPPPGHHQPATPRRDRRQGGHPATKAAAAAEGRRQAGSAPDDGEGQVEAASADSAGDGSGRRTAGMLRATAFCRSTARRPGVPQTTGAGTGRPAPAVGRRRSAPSTPPSACWPRRSARRTGRPATSPPRGSPRPGCTRDHGRRRPAARAGKFDQPAPGARRVVPVGVLGRAPARRAPPCRAVSASGATVARQRSIGALCTATGANGGQFAGQRLGLPAALGVQRAQRRRRRRTPPGDPPWRAGPGPRRSVPAGSSAKVSSTAWSNS